jgi:hypothetical protein
MKCKPINPFIIYKLCKLDEMLYFITKVIFPHNDGLVRSPLPSGNKQVNAIVAKTVLCTRLVVDLQQVTN